MDTFITEDYVNRRQELKRQQQKKKLRIQTVRASDAAMDASNGNSPATLQESLGGGFSSASASPAAAAAIKSPARGSTFDDLFHCFTP